MKKVVLFFGIVAAVALASCGNKQATSEPAAEPAIEVEEVIVVDSIASLDADSTVQTLDVVEVAQ